MQFVIEVYNPELLTGVVLHHLMESGAEEIMTITSQTHTTFTGNSSQVNPVAQKISKKNRDCPVDVLTRNGNDVCLYSFLNGRMTNSQQGITPSDWADVKGHAYSLEVMKFLATTSKKQLVSQFSDFLRQIVGENDLIGVWTFKEIKVHVMTLLANLSGYVSK